MSNNPNDNTVLFTANDYNQQQNYQQNNYQQNYQQNNYQQNYQQGYQQSYQQPAPQQSYQKNDGWDYTPISMWGYLGYELLFCIPCVGLILLLVFSFGGTKKINLRNFARSYFCLLIIAFILGIIISLFAGILGATAFSYGI